MYKNNKLFQYKKEYQYPHAIMLNITNNCNLACKYCFVEQNPQTMSFKTAQQSILYIYNNVQELQKIKQHKNQNIKIGINFFGGEPMLCYKSIIKPLILWAEEKYPKYFNWGITTNCTLLNKESIDFFKEYNVSILTSIDGAEKTQCYNRPCRNGDNSFKLIEKNIQYLLKQFPDLCFRSTGYGPTIQYLYDNYLYAESLGFPSYAIILNERDEWTQEQKNILKEQIEKIQFYRLKQQLMGIKPMFCANLDITSINFKDIDCYNNTLNNTDCLLRCGLGTLGCAIGWDGKIYGCQQDVSLNDKNIFYIGDIYNGINIERHKKLLQKYYNEMINPEIPEKCEKCLLKNTCYGTTMCCPSTNMAIFGNMHQVSDIKCFWNQLIFKTSLLEQETLKENKRILDEEQKNNDEKEKEEQVN